MLKLGPASQLVSHTLCVWRLKAPPMGIEHGTSCDPL